MALMSSASHTKLWTGYQTRATGRGFAAIRRLPDSCFADNAQYNDLVTE